MKDKKYGKVREENNQQLGMGQQKDKNRTATSGRRGEIMGEFYHYCYYSCL